MALSDREFDELVRRIHGEVSEARASRLQADARLGRPPMDRDDLRQLNLALLGAAYSRLARERIEVGQVPLVPDEEQRLSQAVLSMGGLGWAIEELRADDTVENIDINGPGETFVHRADGTKTRLDYPIAHSNDELERWVRNAAARLGMSERRFDEGSPLLILRLPDGSRLFAAMGVCDGVHISIRIHRHPKVELADLQGGGMMSMAIGDFLRAAVLARLNIIISGGTNAGKTTLCRALLNECPAAERIITIEDSYELGIDQLAERHPDVMALEAREANVEGAGEITMSDLVRAALRMNPTRVCVGEVRGDEVLPMLRAMTQGNDGSMCTIHADSSGGVFERLAMYAVESPRHLEPRHTARLVAQAIDLIVHIEHELPRAGSPGGRYVASIREVRGAHETGIETNEVFPRGPDGRAVSVGGHPLSQRTLDRLARVGWTPAVLRTPPGPAANGRRASTTVGRRAR
ncbi:MAG TPA: ATPase, T2SS/T4P/T4SS family [Acidimicrobiales bacterium]|nr:ATPase, T2SS/T4P/T4SS family [Acidimicrobiales bacterium]